MATTKRAASLRTCDVLPLPRGATLDWHLRCARVANRGAPKRARIVLGPLAWGSAAPPPDPPQALRGP
eukprot:7181458-Alexandrium_andersonii.AAC.1